MDDLVRVQELFGGYGKESILKNVSLNIKKGEILGIIGPNGSGKSTLFKLLSRVIMPEKGLIQLEGVNISEIDLKEFCRTVAFVRQDNLIAFPFSVEEIVLMGRIPHLKRMQFTSSKDHDIVNNVLVLTDALQFKNNMIDQLSGGERQRVMIAKALAQEPKLLLLDEPTAHLDIGHQIQVLDLLKELNYEKQLTIAMVLHDLNLASEYCDRLIFLDQGRIFKEGTPKEVLTYENIEQVYKSVVVVVENPNSKKPYVILVPKQKFNKDGSKIN
jgi:iron complex transport system ATP-binding protein